VIATGQSYPGHQACVGEACPPSTAPTATPYVIQGYVVAAETAGVDLPAGEQLVEIPAESGRGDQGGCLTGSTPKSRREASWVNDSPDFSVERDDPSAPCGPVAQAKKIPGQPWVTGWA